jgi:hypothetical protein
MATTPDGTRVEEYVNLEIKRRGIDASATITEGQDNFNFEVCIRGGDVLRFTLENAYLDGLNDTNKRIISNQLDGLNRV